MADWRTDDRELLARILMAEAGNQGPIGMTAVGNVIMNRANTKGYGDGLRGVIMKPGQFSPMNSVTGYARGEQGKNIDSLRPDETHYMVADTLLSGNAGDLTGGATHFFNPDISNPSWAEGKDFTRIGDHVFGSADAGRGGPQTTTTTQGALPMMQEEPQPQQQPQGLLGTLGIQKMQEGAAGETGQRFYERDTFKDTAATLAQAFAGLGSNPALQKAAAGIASQRTEAKARNKTVEYLRANGRGDLADMIDQGMISGKDAAGVMLAKPTDDGTAAMQNYAEYQRILASDGPEAAQEFLAMSRSGTTINTGDVGDGNYLYGSDAGLPPGYRLDKLTGEASVIPGGQVETAAAAAEAAEAARLEAVGTTEGKRDFVVGRDVDRLVAMIDDDGYFDLPEAGIGGNLLAKLGVNQEAVTFKNTLEGLQGQIGFSRLQEMREASKTGGALGAINAKELDLLIGAFGAIKQSTDPSILRSNLLDIKRIMTAIENDPIASSFYYGGGRPPAAPAGDGITVGAPYE